MEAQGATTSQMFLRAKAMVEGKQTRIQQVTLQTFTAITGFRVEKQDEKACQSDLRWDMVNDCAESNILNIYGKNLLFQIPPMFLDDRQEDLGQPDAHNLD